MKFRKLKIAWSVFWGLGCVLLVVLWVRSYTWIDEVWIARRYQLVFGWGKCFYKPIMQFDNQYELHYSEHFYGPLYFQSIWNGDGPLVPKMDGFALPIWSMLTVLAAFTVAPWLRRRFSLGTLLIATTLVAVVLGLAVWAASK